MISLSESLVGRHNAVRFSKGSTNDIEPPRIGELCWDDNSDPWKIRFIYHYGVDSTDHEDELAMYDTSGYIDEILDEIAKKGDYIVGVAMGNERQIFIWGPGGVYYENK